MTIKFNIVQRGRPGFPEAPKKYYPSVVATGRKTTRQLAERISEFSTVSSTDMMALIEAFLKTIPQELAAGNVVELGDFGTFWLKNNAEGMEDPDDVNATQIINLLPRFNPGKEFKKVLKIADFQKGDTILPEEEPPA